MIDFPRKKIIGTTGTGTLEAVNYLTASTVFSGRKQLHGTLHYLVVLVPYLEVLAHIPNTFDWVRGTTQTVILGIIMLTMGLTLTTNDFKILAQHFGHNSRRNLLEMGPDASQETCLSPLSPIWFSTTFMVCHGSKTIVHMVFLQQKVANNFVCM